MDPGVVDADFGVEELLRRTEERVSVTSRSLLIDYSLTPRACERSSASVLLPTSCVTRGEERDIRGGLRGGLEDRALYRYIKHRKAAPVC